MHCVLIPHHAAFDVDRQVPLLFVPYVLVVLLVRRAGEVGLRIAAIAQFASPEGAQNFYDAPELFKIVCTSRSQSGLVSLWVWPRRSGGQAPFLSSCFLGHMPSISVFITFLKSLGFAGRIGFVSSLTLYTALCLPTTPVELASGFVFPLWESTAMCVLGKTLGSMLALIIGRRLLKPIVSNLLVRSVGSAVYQHVISELKTRPIQTMSILRAAPLPTPFKIYGLSILPTELVPAWTYAFIAVCFNSCWSLVWSLAGSSAQDASGLADAKAKGGLYVKLFFLVGLFGMCVQFARFAKAQLQLPNASGDDLELELELPGGSGEVGRKAKADCAAESAAASMAPGKRNGRVKARAARAAGESRSGRAARSKSATRSGR